MLFKPLPDPANRSVLKDYLWGDDTVVVHDCAAAVAYTRHAAPLSVKTTLRGHERYNVHGFFEEVGPGDYLVVNGGQVYESEIDAHAPVESLSVFFCARDVADATRPSLSNKVDEETATICEFPGVRRKADSSIAALLAVLPKLRCAPIVQRQTHSLRLLSAILKAERCAGSSAQFEALTSSTRAELLRRCLIGRAYMDACHPEDVTLTAIANAAGLSRTHFLRAFAQCFGETPYQALRRRRLAEAAAMLKRRKWSVAEVAVTVGYSNFSAFSRAFRAEFGISPSSYAWS
jgi:AraC family transcriptional regulator